MEGGGEFGQTSSLAKGLGECVGGESRFFFALSESIYRAKPPRRSVFFLQGKIKVKYPLQGGKRAAGEIFFCTF